MQIPTDNDLARAIVQTLVRTGNRPGEGLTIGGLQVHAGLRATDCERGFRCALDLGWIEATGSFVKLTESGYMAA